LEVKRLTEVIKNEDDVLIFLDKNRTYLTKAVAGQKFHTHKGFISFNDIIGKPFGCEVKSNLDVKFYVFRPMIHEYIIKMSRATQIMYPKDIGLIMIYAGICPGSIVVEAGTGSGALTTALACYVRPSGKVYSYEIRGELVELAKKNLRRAGMLEYVELKNKDITQGIDETKVDSVVLDLATPWLVIPHAYGALKGGGTIASFSPTIDQVIKTVEALEESKFIDIQTIESFVRKIKVKRGETRPETLMVGHTGYITFAKKSLMEEK